MYEESFNEGKTRCPYVKLVLLGEAGHGKTSLLRLLKGEEFVPEWNSTEGIECDLVSSMTLDGISWKKHDVPDIVSQNLVETGTSEEPSTDAADGPKLIFTTYDFAGQELYRPVHHCFITQRSVFVIVYNSQEYNKLRKEKDESRFKYISYWFNMVSAYTNVMGDPRLGKKPPVFLVGTHQGPYVYSDKESGNGKRFSKLSPDDEKRIRKDLEMRFLNEDDHGRYLGHLKGLGQEHFHFVECSQSGKESGAPGLKYCLTKKAASLPYIKEEYPVRWLQLEKRLMERGVLPLSVVKEEAKEVGFPFPPSRGECKEFEIAMKFLHDIGVIIYPSK